MRRPIFPGPLLCRGEEDLSGARRRGQRARGAPAQPHREVICCNQIALFPFGLGLCNVLLSILMDLLSERILRLLVRRVNAVSVWSGLFPRSPAQPGLSARSGSCANRGIPEIGASSLLFYMETQRLAVWLVNFFFSSRASQDMEGIGGGFGSPLCLPGNFSR